MTTRPKYLTSDSSIDTEADYVLAMFDALRDELGEQFSLLTRDERRAWLKDWQKRHPPPDQRPVHGEDDWELRTPNR